MRRRRPIDRSTDVVRDANLVVIASEDRYAVKQYFEFFKSSKIQFKILETTDGKSAPEHVLHRLDEYMSEFDIGDGDQFWLVIDTDHWIDSNHIQNLVEVVRQCRDKGIHVALSCPCFELWLLLHFEDFPTEPDITCDQISARIKSFVGSYKKKRVCNLPIDKNSVQLAIQRSKDNHTESQDILTETETRLHLIIEQFVEMGIISLP